MENKVKTMVDDLIAWGQSSYEFVQIPGKNDGDCYILNAFSDEYTSAELVEIAEKMNYKPINPRGQKYVLGFCPSSITLVKP